MTVSEGLVSVILPRGWGWLSPDPSLIRATVEALLPGDMDAADHEQIILRSIDDLLAMHAGLDPWQLVGLAAWTQPALIGDSEQILSASLLTAIQYVGRPFTIDEVVAGAAASTLHTQVMDVRTLNLTYGPAVRMQTQQIGPAETISVRSWIYLVPVHELNCLALLMFATPDEPDWESFGQLFDAMADTFAVATDLPGVETQPSGT